MNEAYAQSTPAGGAGNLQNPNPFASLAPFILIFIVFYFLLIRPQKKKLQEEQDMIKALKPGDEIYTKSGLVGIMRNDGDQFVQLEVSNGVAIKVLKSQIGGPINKLLSLTRSEETANKKK